MKKSLAVGIILLFIFSGIIPVASSYEISSNNIIYVDDDGRADYTRIQDAIDNASEGDTIYVYSGVYNETLEVNKSVNLIGEDKNNTIIENSARNYYFINFNATHINMTGFSIICSWKRNDLQNLRCK